ncbi:MAG: 4-hydroxybenzoate polyprenyltransferase [Verrucomicrobiales bacterium]|jgi:4-hydroxybenzoate polyprenyltransferase
MKRWWIYQRERFPVFAHGLLILAFSSSAVCFSALLGGSTEFPSWPAFAAAFVTSFIFFLQLRIADEFKDIEEDTEFRPYRPVPRGLVTLKELGFLFVAGAGIQLGIALLLHPPLVGVLLIAWLYLALMSREFFAREWLKARPITYLWTHMGIMPLVDLYATATEWMPRDAEVPQGLIWFLVVSFFNGLVIEVGRKLRAAEGEEEGVPTYTRLWGERGGPLVWFAFLVVTAISASFAGHLIGFGWQTLAVVSVLLVIAGALVLRFVKNPTTALAKRFELMAGVWTLAMYFTLGLIPMLLS